MTAAREQVEHLDDLLRNQRASVILDPKTGGQMLTFDAQIGRASGTMGVLKRTVDDQHAAARRLYELRQRLDMPVGRRLRDPALKGKSWAKITALLDEAEVGTVIPRRPARALVARS
jgi:hypothetical protein